MVSHLRYPPLPPKVSLHRLPLPLLRLRGRAVPVLPLALDLGPGRLRGRQGAMHGGVGRREHTEAGGGTACDGACEH